MDFISHNFCRNSSLWEEGINLNGSYPRFSACFQNTYMVWVPCGLFWLFLPNYILSLSSKRDEDSVHKYSRSITKTIINYLLCLLMVAEISLLHMTGIDMPEQNMAISSIIKAATFVAILAVRKLEERKGISSSTSGLMFLFWFSMMITGFVPIYTQITEQTIEIYAGSSYHNVLYWILVTMQFFLHFFGEKPPVAEGKPGDKEPCPEIYACFPSKLSFSWMTGLITQGYEKPLTEADMFDIRPQDKGDAIIPQFEEIWNQELKSCQNYNESLLKQPTDITNGNEKRGIGPDKDTAQEKDEQGEMKLKKPSLWKVLLKMSARELVRAAVIRMFFDVLQLLNPVLLGMLITFIQNKSTEHAWKGYALACSFYLNSVLTYALFYNNDIYMETLSLKLKTCLNSAIYKKSLKISNKTRKSRTVGELVNLLSVDGERIDGMNWNFMFSVSMPFRFLLSIYLLWSTLDSAVLIGLPILFLMLPINYIINKKQGPLDEKMMETKDKRSKIMSEIFNGIKVLKFYVWESSFETKLNDLREKEMGIVKTFHYIDVFRTFIFDCIPFSVVLFSFSIYIFHGEGHFLDAGTAFTALSLFDQIKWPLFMLPEIVSSFIRQRTSMKRICDFLHSGEIDPENVQHEDIPGVAIKVDKGAFSWDDKIDPTLKGINLEIPKGQLVAIVGQVGMGKSSLLSAFLGEMDKLEGKVNINGSVGYVPQQAWIRNSKLRDNILFGKSLERKKYDKVIEACAMRSDLDMLASGDKIEIGEKGINLSGGQKQRINLARALYYNADIYLMDDPLSAVDSHVGKHIFDEVIGDNGMLKNKTRVLVTHGVHWLPKVDNIIVMKDGRISEMGTYRELLSHDGDFSQFLKNYHSSSDEESEEEDNDLKMRVLRRMKSLDEKYDIHRSVDSKNDIIESPSSELRRQMFTRSISSYDDEHDEKHSFAKSFDGGSQIEDEAVETGQIKFDVLKKYIQTYGYVWIVVIFFLALVRECFTMGQSMILTYWTEDPILKNTTLSNTTEYKSRNFMFIAIYAGMGLGDSIFNFGYVLAIFLRNVVTTRKLHSTMLNNILRCPMAFYETTPVARIINRFTSDFEKIDHPLPHYLKWTLFKLYHFSAIVIVICYNTPLFLTVIIPVTFLYRIIQQYFVTSVRQIERLHSKSYSPVMGHFGETLAGVSTIRAYGLEDDFMQQSQEKLQKHITYSYIFECAHKWLGVRLEAVSHLLVSLVASFAVMSPDISGSVAGLSVMFIINITMHLNGLVHDSVRMETTLIGIERIKEYIDKETEAPLVTGKRPSKNWPTNGEINIQNYQTKYRPGLDLVLRGINCDIKGGEKVGVIGRTGAGKSSLMSSLFRLIESADGKIEIDGINIAEIGLRDLRSHLTILPQDPVLFFGSLRMNLDPFENFTNDELWTALEHAHLKKFVLGLSDGLQYECGEGGQNLSHGQRQLVCLARALLYKTKILILDEATASVDMETDDLIQKTIRTEFKECTVLAIAHRLNTIMDYDKVLVLGQGLVLEFDTPENLLNNKNSVFYGMAKTANIV